MPVPDGPFRRALVTGANGFVARHVITELARRDVEVVAVGHQGEPPLRSPLVGTYLACDLTDLAQVEKLPLGEVDAVINLAGLAAVGESFSRRDLYLAVNVGVLETVCTVASKRGLGLRILAVSSGAVYGGRQPMPLSESAEVDPTSSPYAESKLAMEECARTYRDAGVDCVVVRPFNHIGPGQAAGFLVPDLFAQIEQAVGSGGPLSVGNLETQRDYTDVRDVASAYADLAAAPALAHGLYNVCRGQSWAGTDVLAAVLDAVGVRDLEVRVDPSRFRPSDQPEIIGDSARLRSELDWEPSISLAQSIRDFVAARA